MRSKLPAKREPSKQDLILLMGRLVAEGTSWSSQQEPSKISPTVYETAKDLIEQLPDTFGLPQINPDGDGGLMMTWGTKHHKTIVVVDERKLHAVIKKQGSPAEYIKGLEFVKGASVPEAITKAIETHLLACA